MITGYNQRNHDILSRLTAILNGTSSYARIKSADGMTLFCEHPFTETEIDTMFVGNVGTTASIDHWVSEVMGRINAGQVIANFNWYLCDVDMDGEIIGQDVYCEALMGYIGYDGNPVIVDAVMVGGMTNFSGEGSRGFNDLKAIVTFLGGALGVNQYGYKVDAERYADSVDAINSEILAQSEEEESW